MTATRTDETLDQRMDRLGVLFEARLGEYFSRCGSVGVDNLHDGSCYSMGLDMKDPAKRGKRIRPLLCLLTAEALDSTAEQAMPFAISVELMHNFALVHDDIQDGDVMRRGRDAAWVKYGLHHAINIGDYLLVQAIRVLAEWGPSELPVDKRFRLQGLIGSALDHTHIGQALEINYRGTERFTQEEYLRIVREKTGYYLAAPIQGGAIVAGAPDAVIDAIARMALFLGPLFQIIDDIIDLTDGKGREAIGSDIREGKRSFLVAHAAEHGSDAERRELFAILDKPREQTSADDIARAVAIFEAHGSIEAGHRYCEHLYEDSKLELKGLPETLGAVLGEVFERLVKRRQ